MESAVCHQTVAAAYHRPDVSTDRWVSECHTRVQYFRSLARKRASLSPPVSAVLVKRPSGFLPFPTSTKSRTSRVAAFLTTNHSCTQRDAHTHIDIFSPACVWACSCASCFCRCCSHSFLSSSCENPMVTIYFTLLPILTRHNTPHHPPPRMKASEGCVEVEHVH